MIKKPKIQEQLQIVPRDEDERQIKLSEVKEEDE